MSVRPRRARGTVTGAFRSALFRAIVGALVSFSIADLNPFYFVLTFLGVCVAWFWSVRPARPMPRGLINSVLLLVVALAGIELLRVGVGVSAFAIFVAMLLVVKLLDLRTPRDDAQVLVLCLATLVAAVLTSNSFLTGVAMLVECVLLLRAFLLFQAYRVVRMGRGQNARLTRRARIDIRSMMLVSGFLCAVVGSVLFVVMPRNIGRSVFGQWRSTGSISGFSDKVELSRPGRISSSSKPVMNLTVRDRNGMNIGSESKPPIYLRGAVLDRYNNGSWVRNTVLTIPLSEHVRLRPPMSTIRGNREDADNTRWDQEYIVSMNSVSDGLVNLFVPWRPVEFHVLGDAMRVGFDFARGEFIKDGMGGEITYAVRTINEEYRLFPDKDGAGVVRNPVDPDPIDPRIVELARQVVRKGGIDPDPATRPVRQDGAAVRLLETFLRTQYSYTLEAQPVPEGMDATRWFLFQRRAGHCEFYASALTLMARAVGVPARMVTGYIASDFNSVTGQYTVRESNAHAWVEAEVYPGHWRTFDGTPPSDFHSQHVPDPSIARSLVNFYESIEYIWGRMIVGFDARARDRVLGKRLGDFGLSRLSDRLLERLAAGRSRLIFRAALVATIVFSVSMFLGILLLRWKHLPAGLADRIRDLLGRFGLNPVHAQGRELEARRLELAINHALSRLGRPRPLWRPLKIHLRLLEDDLADAPGLLEALAEASELLYEQRFARNAPPAGRAEGVIAALRASEKTIRSHSPHHS